MCQLLLCSSETFLYVILLHDCFGTLLTTTETTPLLKVYLEESYRTVRLFESKDLSEGVGWGGGETFGVGLVLSSLRGEGDHTEGATRQRNPVLASTDLPWVPSVRNPVQGTGWGPFRPYCLPVWVGLYTWAPGPIRCRPGDGLKRRRGTL